MKNKPQKRLAGFDQHYAGDNEEVM